MYTFDEVSKALEVFGEFDGSEIDLGLGNGKESDFETRTSLLVDLLAGIQGDSPLDVAGSLQDIRVRDGFLRSVHDLYNLGSFEEVQRILDGLLFVASNSLGTVRNSAMACFGGISWIAGDGGEALRAVLASDGWGEYSLLQLLDIAVRHNVPSSVWSSSLMAVSLESCLQGAS
jgi:hypothetical protein